MEDGEITEDAKTNEDVNEDDSVKEATDGNLLQSGCFRRDGNQRPMRKANSYMQFAYFCLVLLFYLLHFCFVTDKIRVACRCSAATSSRYVIIYGMTH